MRIGHKLTLGFVGLTLLIAAIGYVSLHKSQSTLEKAIGENSAVLAAQTLNQIQRNIHNRIEIIQAYTKDELAGEYLEQSNARFELLPDVNSYITQVNSDWVLENNQLTPLMVELTENRLAEEVQSLRSYYNKKYGYPLFAVISVTNKFGVNVAQTNKTTDYYQADEEWWQIAKKDGLFVSDVAYKINSGIFSTNIAVRIDNPNGEFLGVIKAVLNLRETFDIINDAKAAAEYKTLHLHLINKEGKIIYSTKGYDFFQDARIPLISDWECTGRPEHKCYIINKKVGESEILYAYAQSKNYRDFKGLGWTLLTGTETEEIFTPIAGLKHTMLLAGIAIMGLALLAGTATYRSITTPIAQLHKATVQIASGNLDTILTTKATGEIGQLACSFQKMAQQLKKTISDLNGEITERKKAETGLYESKRFLDNIFDAMQDGINVLDTELNNIKVNAWMEKMYPDRMPLVGKKCYNAYHNRTSVCPWCPSVKALQTGQTHTNLVPYPCEERQTGWLELSAFPLKNADGNVVGVIEHVKDVTKQKIAEQILTEKTEQVMRHHNTLLKLANMPEQDFDSLLHTVTEQDAEVLNVEQVGVWFFNQDRTEIVCRDQFIKTKNVHESGESMKARDFPHYFKTLETSRIIATNNGSADPRTCEFADIYLLPNGITSMIDVPVRLHGQIVGIICHEHVGPPREWTNGEQDFAASVADMISLKLEAAEHKKAEEAIEQLNKDLEATIQELSRSNRQLQDFVHIAAHDLKTPVRGIGTLADWIINDYGDWFDEQGREQIRLLKARVVRIDKLIDGMLQFSKIVRTRQKEIQVDLNTVLTDVISKIKRPGNIEIAVDSLPAIICEREHIGLLFESLLSNAATFMDKPKGQIKVGCVEQGNFWKFYVWDNGPGIEHQHFERIFKIFQTLHGKESPQTAGVGLAVARKIVELYGGKIWVESQPGSGSTFFFTLLKNREEPVYANAKAYSAC